MSARFDHLMASMRKVLDMIEHSKPFDQWLAEKPRTDFEIEVAKGYFANLKKLRDELAWRIALHPAGDLKFIASIYDRNSKWQIVV